MKTKTTICDFATDLNFKISIIKCFLVLFLFFNTTISFGQSGCSIDLRVEKDRNIRSTPPEGTYYSMIITNKGNSSDTINFSSLNVNSSCSNTDGSSTATNVNIDVAILDSNQASLNQISLNAGQSVTFLVHISVPIGTAINKWCCTQIIAKSQSCSDYQADTILHTLVINPNED